jgi:uncharacterized protein YndB with AHSA1/START domain
MEVVLKKALTVMAGIVALLVATVTGVGAWLPVGHTATAVRTLPAPPEVVWVVVASPQEFMTWRTDVERVTLLAPRGGLPTWVEHNGPDSLTLQVTELDPPRHMVTRIADTGIPFGGTWTYELSADGAGTRIRVTEDGEIYNPLFRFVARFLIGYHGTLDAYLEALEARISALDARTRS